MQNIKRYDKLFDAGIKGSIWKLINSLLKFVNFIWSSHVIIISQVEDFMKPYSDEPEDAPTFMGAYRDQEDED